MIGKLKELLRLSGGEWMITFTTRNDPRKIFDTIKGEAEIEIRKYSPKRSSDANRLCWALCADIGRAMNPPLDRIEVYRMAIEAVGVWIDKELPVWDVETVRRRWEGRGDGWLFKVVDDAGVGHKLCSLYFGTSTYSVDEMRVVLDWLVDQAEQMGIVLRLSKEEEERALAQWGKA